MGWPGRVRGQSSVKQQGACVNCALRPCSPLGFITAGCWVLQQAPSRYAILLESIIVLGHSSNKLMGTARLHQLWCCHQKSTTEAPSRGSSILAPLKELTEPAVKNDTLRFQSFSFILVKVLHNRTPDSPCFNSFQISFCLQHHKWGRFNRFYWM